MSDDMFYARVCQERDQLRAELAAAAKQVHDLEAEIAVRDNMGNEVLRILREATGKRDFHSEMEAAKYAAEIIRESGWRPIAEFTDENEYLTGGLWDDGKWYEYGGKLYWLLGHRCTHARVSPAPPAREVPNDRG